MNEHDLRAAGPEGAAAPAGERRIGDVGSGRRLTVVALVRGENAAARAAAAETRLLRTIAEWAPGSGLDLLLRGGARGGRVRLELAPLGDVPPGWQSDVRHALADVAILARAASPMPIPAAPAELFELVRDPAREHRPADEEWTAERASPRAPEVVWPRPVHEGGFGLVEAVRTGDRAFVRALIAAPHPLERMMTVDAMSDSWDRLTLSDFDAYLGVAVRIRAFAGHSGTRSIAPLRAAVRAGATGLTLAQSPAADRVRFAALGAADLAGHVRPLGWALGLLHLPAAGVQGVIGMPSRPRPIAARPLDPVPARPATPIVVGSARTASGARTPAALDASDLPRHGFIEGRSGAGKSTLLTRIAGELSRQGIGFTLLEHHGTGVDQALRAIDPAFAPRVTVIRHGDPASPAGLNLLAERDDARRERAQAELIELVQQMFDRRGEGIVGPKWRRWFGLLCDGVVAHFGAEATLLHVASIGADMDRVSRLSIALRERHPELSHRLRAEIADLRSDEAASMVSWASSKFQPLVGQQAMRQIVGRSADAVDVDRLLAEGDALLVDLGAPELGAAASRMLGALWLLKHVMAMGRRPDRSRPHVLLVDEAHLYTFGALPGMLAEARKFGLGVWLASQSLDGLAPDLQAAVEANVGTHVCFRLSPIVAARASLRLGGWPVDELVRLPDLHAAATLLRGSTATDPFLLAVPHARDEDRRRTHDGDAVAAAITERSAARLAAGRRRDAPTDAAILRALAHRASPARADDPASVLDEWVARRR